MQSLIRQQFNKNFTPEKYKAFQAYVDQKYNCPSVFRVAETPVFISNDIRRQLLEACEEIAEVFCRDDFKERSKSAIPKGQEVPGEDEHTTFLQMDFGICRGKDGSLIPQLIEVQGFPTLYFFQNLLAEAYRKFYDIPDNFSHLFGGLDSASYINLLRHTIVESSNPKNVVLLEVEPTKQVTRIDFYATAAELGIKVLCISDLKVAGKDLYYFDEKGNKVGVEKIYNRVIFDELMNRDDLQREFYFSKEANVEWIGHPNWFFRISKHSLPLLKSKYNPTSMFLNEVDRLPQDLHNYVLKPLYSFAGSGVIINLNQYDLDAIKDPENYILQQKVSYEPIIETPDEKSKFEIRMLFIWDKGEAKPRLVNNLLRLSKGEMVGVRYNKDKEWVGGSLGFFEQ